MDEKKDDVEIPAPTADQGKEGENTPPRPDPSHDDHIKQERAKIEEKKKFSKTERLLFEKKKIDEQLQAEGYAEPAIEDEDQPLTIGMYKKMQQSNSQKTALELADSIENEDEREVVKHYLTDRIVPSGNPQEDVRTALAIVHSIRNAEIAEEAARRGGAKSFASFSGSPGKPPEGVFEPTDEERYFMEYFPVKKEDVIRIRNSKQNKETV